MLFLNIGTIAIAPNRQRREFDEARVQELNHSIEEIGLLHPIVVRETKEGGYTLVAGERRLRAITDLYDLGGQFKFEGEFVPAGQVPCCTLGELSPLEAMEAEFEENIRRVDLNWQERATATTDLMKLRVAQAAARGEAPPTIADLAREVSDAPAGDKVKSLLGSMAEDLKVARSLHDPEVATAKSRTEALKIIKKKEARKQNELLGEAVGRTFTSAAHVLVNQNGKEYAASLADGTFDVILTDPPYGMGADQFGDSGGKAAGEHFYSDGPEVLAEIMDWFPREAFRLAKPLAHLYLFCDPARFDDWRLLLQANDWEVFRTPMIWAKANAYRAPWPDGGPQRRYETFVYARKGKMPVQKMLGDVLTYAADENLGHQAQKPVALFQDILSRSAVPGMKVWDPFCGTGPLFPAAHALKCTAYGCEIDKAAYGIAAGRIKELT